MVKDSDETKYGINSFINHSYNMINYPDRKLIILILTQVNLSDDIYKNIHVYRQERNENYQINKLTSCIREFNKNPTCEVKQTLSPREQKFQTDLQ